MKHSCRFLFLIVLLPYFAYAQKGYKAGFVINLKGDTSRGLIHYVSLINSPKMILFKSGPDAKPAQLTTDDITCFSVYKGDEYRKYTGAITRDQIDISHELTDRDTTVIIASVFLKVLEKGKNVWFYSYSDDIKTRFFVADTHDFKIVELIYRIYYDLNQVNYVKGRTVIENTYMKQLFALANKYNALDDALQRDIENSDYRQFYLRDIIKKINSVKH